MGLEEQLCLLLARSRSSPEAEQEVRQLLARPVNWDRMLQLVRAHQILPLVCSNLTHSEFAGVAQPLQAELTDLFRHNALRNLLLAEELARVLSCLAEAQVPAIPLKGIALAESLYGDAALRVCADIDLLVPPQHFPAAFQRLRNAGYEAGFTAPQLVDLIARYGKDCSLMRQDGLHWYPLQLHAGLVWGGPTERSLSEAIWSEARAINFHGAPAYALSPEWEFLYLAVHAARHGLFPLKWLVDLDRLCRRESMDWEQVKAKAQRLGWKEVVGSTLSTCATLLGTPVPAAFHVTGAGDQPSFTLPESSHSPLQVPKETLFAIRLLNSPAQQLRFAASRLLIPTAADCRFIRLPASLFFLYYALRPVRLAFTAIGWLMQAGRGSKN